MNIQVLLSPTFALILFVTFKLVKQWKRRTLATKKKVLPPPGPWKLPLIGNLHQMIATGSSIGHTILAKLAEKHRPIMHLKVGEISVVVISSADLAEAAFTTHDLTLAQRPDNVFLETLTYNNSGVALSPYGDHWRFFRKLCATHLLNPKRVHSFKFIREEEVSIFINSINKSSSRHVVVNLSKKLLGLTISIVSRATLGKKISSKSIDDDDDDDDELTFLLNQLMALASKNIRWKLDKILEDIIEEHKSTSIAEEGEVQEKEEYLVDVLLRLQASADPDFPITVNTMKAVILDMLTGGLENPATIIEWAMAELLRNPRVLKKAQEEVGQALNGKTNKMEETTGGIKELNYLKSIVKETLRLHPPIPVIPREARENCEIGGYELPKKTKVLINVWAIGRDEKYWKDANYFYPERFLQSSSSNYESIPFGGGRRICPGVSFGTSVVELSLAHLLYWFDWKLPNGIKPQDLDMTEISLVATAKKKNDLLVIPVPFINPPHLRT